MWFRILKQDQEINNEQLEINQENTFGSLLIFIDKPFQQEIKKTIIFFQSFIFYSSLILFAQYFIFKITLFNLARTHSL